MSNLCAIERIFKNYYVIRVERYVALPVPLRKEILRDKNDAEILMMTAFGKYIHDHLARRRFPHKIVDYD